MAQQNEADYEWTEAQNANDVEAGDDVRLRNHANGSVELEGTVRSSLGDVGTVQVRVGGVRTSEVYAEGGSEFSKRGTCWTYSLEVRREVATDGGVEAEDAQAGDEVEVAYTAGYSGDLKTETGTVVDSPYQHRSPQDDEVFVEVRREANGEMNSVYLRVPLHGGNVYSLHHATKRHDHRQGSLVGLVAREDVEGAVCMNCRTWLDSFTPVNTGHATTGDSGCPQCLEAEGVRKVCHEVGQERTVTGGYVNAQARDHGRSISLEAARAICQD